MIACPACGHFVSASNDCPFCGVGPRMVRVTTTALLLGLAACTGADSDKDSSHSGETPARHSGSTQVDYGVPSTYESGGSGDTGN